MKKIKVKPTKKDFKYSVMWIKKLGGEFDSETKTWSILKENKKNSNYKRLLLNDFIEEVKK